jgi:hypothetical protein
MSWMTMTMTMTTSRMKKDPETIRRQLSQAVIGLGDVASKVPAKIIPHSAAGG